MIIVWLLAGIGAVSIAFFVPGSSSELWPAINTAAIPLIVYILALAVYTLRPPITLRARIVAWFAILLVGGATYSAWSGMETQSHWQRGQLMKIHSVIVRGIMASVIPQRALDVLDAYYKQGPKKKETLAQVFQRLNKGAAVGVNIYEPQFDSDTTNTVFVQSLSDNEIVLLGLHAFSKGRNAEFRNYGGRAGLVQEKYTLTEKGVVYESEN